MALVTCPDCEKRISTDAPSCPQCGRVMAKVSPHWTQDRNLGCLGFCVVFFVLPALLFWSCGR